MNDKPRILVVDDDPAVLSVLGRGLRYEGYLVESASSGQEALRLVSQARPSLVILDIMMPGLDGLITLQRLREIDSHLPILFLTGRDAPADQIQGLDQGADDYVTKPFTFEVLMARVRVLLRRYEGEQDPILRFLDLQLNLAARRANRGSRQVELTSTEYELLRQFLENPRQVLTREALMESVWGYDFGGNTNVLETYVKQLRQKLEADGESRLIQTVRGIGYTLRED